MIHQSHLHTAVTLLGAYNGNMPFSHYIKKYFGSNKKHGSKDRKQISALCYNYFRLGHALPQATIEERVLAGCFLCGLQFSALLEYFRPEWNAKIQLSQTEKCSIIGIESTDLFSFPSFVPDSFAPGYLAPGFSPETDNNNKSFCLSFLTQPSLYLRLRPGMEERTQQKLAAAGIAFDKISDSCLALDNATGIDNIIELDKEAVVQDLNSQRTGEFFEKFITAYRVPGTPYTAWDCCAASGGKSILLYDVLGGKLGLSVSDVRSSMLHNLDLRFAKAGIKKYTSFTADLAADGPGRHAHAAGYDVIICDAPCTGSGTWARTPEQHCFFKPEEINIYAARQQKIAAAAIKHLLPGGLFFYITCSVFRQENEDAVDFIQQQGLQLLHQELLAGWNKKADSLFIAVFSAPAKR
jgi:16S rRNA (cytosine967-C5)-methyltransferase